MDEKKRTYPVVVQKWEESEKGWGIRPDGYSLHLNEEDRETYIKNYWDGMPNEVQEEYSHPSGTPYLADVDEETYEKIKASPKGIRVYKNNYPGSGGTDGWK